MQRSIDHPLHIRPGRTVQESEPMRATVEHWLVTAEENMVMAFCMAVRVQDSVCRFVSLLFSLFLQLGKVH